MNFANEEVQAKGTTVLQLRIICIGTEKEGVLLHTAAAATVLLYQSIVDGGSCMKILNFASRHK